MEDYTSMEKHNYYDENTKVLMANGMFKKIKNIAINDKVITGSGDIATVTNTCKKHSYSAYEVTSSKDVASLCIDKKCILASRDRKGDKDEISIDKYLKTSNSAKTYYRLPITSPILKFENVEELSETGPYVLATLIYNSSYDKGMRISIKEYLKYKLDNWLANNNLTLKHYSYNSYDVLSTSGHRSGHNGIKLAEELGISEQKVKDRSIPDFIKYGDLELRKGFIDATIELCGTPNGPAFSISKRNIKCAQDLAFMAKSVGYNAYLRNYIKGGLQVHEVYITFNKDITPDLISKKLIQNYINPCLLKFKVNKTNDKDVYALTLNKDNTLITDDFIVINADEPCNIVPTALINNSLNVNQSYLL